MSVLFDHARSSTRSPGRSTSGLWLSVVVHAAAGVVLAVTIGVPGQPPAPRPHPMRVSLPAVVLPSDPVVAPRLPAPPPPPRPVREVAKAEAPKPLPVAPVVTKPIEPPPPVAPTAAPGGGGSIGLV